MERGGLLLPTEELDGTFYPELRDPTGASRHPKAPRNRTSDEVHCSSHGACALGVLQR